MLRHWKFPQGFQQPSGLGTGPQGRGLVDNLCLLHQEELGLGGGKFVWVQAAGVEEYWRTRDSWEVMENAMQWSKKPLEEKTSGYPGSSPEVRTEWIHGRGREDGGENI